MSNRPFTFICSHDGCAAQYNRKDRLEIHLRSHTGERPFVCSYDDCDKSYARLQHLKRHELIHEESNIKCSYEDCIAVLKTTATLQKHIDIYHLKKRIKVYKCSLCNEEFPKRSLLKFHENRHKNVRPYKCPHDGCIRSFLTPSKLSRHHKVHEGYKCTENGCDVVSPTWSLRLKHMKVVHSYRKVVAKCSTCSKVFRRTNNLKKHEATHIIPEARQVIECPESNCYHFYFEMKNLKHHMKRNHSGPFKCHVETCSLSFQNKESLEKHYKQAHNTDVPLSSKKRKAKAKRKKRIKLSLAAKLAGFTEMLDTTKNIRCATTTATEAKCDKGPNMVSPDLSFALPQENKEDVPQNDFVSVEVLLDNNAADSFNRFNELHFAKEHKTTFCA